MKDVTVATDRLIIPELPIGGVELAVDVGGGNGAFLNALLARQPDARGIAYDLPGVAEDAERQRSGARSESRLQFLAGNFFASVPAGADLYLLKMVLHDWNDSDAVRILQNIRTAVPPQGRLLVIEMIIPEGRQRHPAMLTDLNMMVMTGGRERTQTEFRRILESAEFCLVRTIPTLTPFSIIEAMPAGSTGE